METTFFSILADTTSNGIAYKIGQILGFVLVLAIPAIFILSLVKLIITKRKTWLIGLIITGVLGLGFAGVVVYTAIEAYKKGAATAAKTMEEKEEGGKKNQLVKTDDKLLQFELPARWRTLKELPENGSLRQGDLVKEQYMMVLSQAKEDLEDDYNLSLYSEGCLQNIKEVSKSFNQKKSRSVEVDGCEMMEVEVDSVIDGVKIKYLNGYLETETHYHQVMLWTLPTRWEKSKPIFKSVLSSIKTLEPGS